MRTCFLILATSLITSCLCRAQIYDLPVGPEKGGHEIQLWAGGGHSVAGGRGNTGAFNAGLQIGRAHV